ncbi:MAG: hypothetical protein WC824_07890, partial [Bacteroidota bacterium]
MLYRVVVLKDGALPLMPKTVESTAYLIGEEGMNILAVAKGMKGGKFIITPMFEISTFTPNPQETAGQLRSCLMERVEALREVVAERHPSPSCP